MRKRTFFGLAALAALGVALHAWAGTPVLQTYVASFDWNENDPAFGGLSALELDADGTGFLALSDRGTVYTGVIERQADGQIEGVSNVTPYVLRGQDGLALDQAHDDSEGLALAPDGQFFVAQEGPARVLRFGGPTAAAKVLPQNPDFAALQVNSALEALAIDANGALFTLPERSGAIDRPFPVYRFANGAWTQPFDIPRDGGYLPTAADFGPDGRLYILERSFQGIRGFQSRVRRFTVTGDRVSAPDLVLETTLGQHGNLEGLSVWQDAGGTLRLTMVSDDNFRFFLRTSLVEYTVTD
jgi:hypothetical protein